MMSRLFSQRRSQFWRKQLNYTPYADSLFGLTFAVVAIGFAVLNWSALLLNISMYSQGNLLPNKEFVSVNSRHLLQTTNNSDSEIASEIHNSNTTHEKEEHKGMIWQTCEYEKANYYGAWLVLYIFGILVTFIALAIICDDFFIASLETISEKLHLSEDVAGATFMAAGSSAPELFTSVAGVAVETDVGIGTIVGSAAFNILIIVALSAVFSEKALYLDWRPLLRDSTFYALSILTFIGLAWDGYLYLWETIILLVLYFFYIVLMKINPRLMTWMGNWHCVNKVGDSKTALTDDKSNGSIKVSTKDRPIDGTPDGQGGRRPSAIDTDAGMEAAVLSKRFHHKRGSVAQFVVGGLEDRGRVTFSGGIVSDFGSATSSTTGHHGTPATARVTHNRPSLPMVPLEAGGSGGLDDARKLKRIKSLGTRPTILPPLHKLPKLDEAAPLDQITQSKQSIRSKSDAITEETEDRDSTTPERGVSYYEVGGHMSPTSRKRSEATLEPQPNGDAAPVGDFTNPDLQMSGERVGTAEEAEDDDDATTSIQLCPCLPCCPPVRATIPRRTDASHDPDTVNNEVEGTNNTTNEQDTQQTKGVRKCWTGFSYGLRWVLFIFSFPFVCLFTWTIPDCSQKEKKKWYWLSFTMSVTWIAGLSFACVIMVEKTGCIIGIDAYTMGLVVIAIGTSIPDLLSSILVARDGYGDMAVSNAIGSNVFDIDLGLGLPFFIRILIDLGIKPEPRVDLLQPFERKLFTTGVIPFVPHVKFGFILLGILFFVFFCFLLNRFHLSKRIGLMLSLTYALFLVYAFIQELVCNKQC